MNPTNESDSEHRHPSARSLWALDGLNFFLADVRDGMGPFLGTFLRDQHQWDPGKVGIALAASQLGTVLAQTPAGALIDKTRRKRLAIGVAAMTVAIGCIVLYVRPTFAAVVVSQTLIGVAASIFPPAIAALTLGLVGRALMSKRTGRNEAFNHGGNVVAAALAGGVTHFFGYGAMFLLVSAMACASIAAAALIREREIDHVLARGSDDGQMDHTGHSLKIGTLFHDRRITIFIVSAVLFHFANAAMLPLVGQKSADGLEEGAAVLMSACIITAQLVMVPVAIVASRLAESWGRKPVFLIGFTALPIRGLLYCLSTNPTYLVAVQILDGIGAGIFGVVSVLIVADLTKGTGRFNLTQGALATATGLGAGLSNVLTGFVVKAWGFDAGFITLSAIAAAAALFFHLAMPEVAPLATFHGTAKQPEPASHG